MSADSLTLRVEQLEKAKCAAATHPRRSWDQRGGNDAAIVALYLGHESVDTTRIYIDADLSVKERAIARAAPASIARRRFQAGDALLAYLNSL